MFTDGVSEARSASDEEFGEDRLLARCPDATECRRLRCCRMFATVRAFCQHADQSDDVTVTVTRFGA